MTNWLISFSRNWSKKEIMRFVVRIITCGILYVLAWIGTFPDVPFILGLFVCFLLGFVLLFFKKTFSIGNFLILVGLILMLVVIIKNKEDVISDSQENNLTCEELARHIVKMDSAGWKLYQNKNPEMIGFIGCAMLEYAKNNSLDFDIPWVKYADSLLDEARKADEPYAYYGRAYKEYYGIGCEKSFKEAVRDAQICLSMRHCDQAYSLLEQMNLDSIEYPNLYERVQRWRDSINNLDLKRFNLVKRTFFPNLLPKIVGLEHENHRIFAKCHSMYESLYNGDTTSSAWKIIHENKERIKRWPIDKGLLAAYYWGIGKVDSARLYCDSIGGFYNEQNKFHDFCAFVYNEGSFEKNVFKDLDNILHYSSLDNLESYYSMTKDPLLQFAFKAALVRKDHLLNIEAPNDAENMLTIESNTFIKQLRPRVK